MSRKENKNENLQICLVFLILAISILFQTIKIDLAIPVSSENPNKISRNISMESGKDELSKPTESIIVFLDSPSMEHKINSKDNVLELAQGR